MTSLVHVSDLHFGTHDARIAESLADMIARLAPDLVVATGDFTSTGRNPEFAAAAAFVRALPAPCLAVPGNHDVPLQPVERWRSPMRRWESHLAPLTLRSWSDGAVAVLGLDSVKPFGNGFDWSRGALAEWQVAAAEQWLGGVPGSKWRVLALHHPLHVPPHSRLEPLRRASLRRARFGASGADLVLAGHLHATAFDRIERPWVAQCGTSASLRQRGEAPSFLSLSFESERLVVAAYVWGGAAWAEAWRKEAVRS
jgi:3',5'-cyclic AMP phosphodiesterase CpdA